MKLRLEYWNKMYELAKVYYEKHGNLNIRRDFKTINGYEYDENGLLLGRWINTQRNSYKGTGTGKLTDYQIKLLNDIGMIWFSNNIDKKLQNEEINSDNLRKKQIEILNRFKTYIGKINNQTLPSKEEINENFIKELYYH